MTDKYSSGKTPQKYAVKWVITYTNGKTYTIKDTALGQTFKDKILMQAKYFIHPSKTIRNCGIVVRLLDVALVQHYKEDGSIRTYVNPDAPIQRKKIKEYNPASKTKMQKDKEWQKKINEYKQPKDEYSWAGKSIVAGDMVGYVGADGTPYWVAIKSSDWKITDRDGFIEWRGGDCPVPKGTMVHVKYRDGNESIVTAEVCPWEENFKKLKGGYGAISWTHFLTNGDIIAYKVYEEPKKTIPHHDLSESYNAWKHKQNIDGILWDSFITNEDIKTTYTFWLGKEGE